MRRNSYRAWVGFACVAAVCLGGCQRKSAAPPPPAQGKQVIKAPGKKQPPPKKVPMADTRYSEQMQKCTFKLGVSGEFSDKPDWDVNLINAPVTASSNKPPKLKVDVAVLRDLNLQRSKVVNRIMGRRKLMVLAGEPVIKPLTGPSGDRHLVLNIKIGPENGMGGHASGLTFDVELSSRHRAAGNKAVVRKTIVARSADEAVAELDRKLDAAIGEVYARFKKGLAAAAEQEKSARPFFVLAVKMGNLDAKQQAHVKDSVLPCLFGQGWTHSFKHRKSPRGMLRYAVHYEVQGDQTAGKIVGGIASSFAAAASSHGKSVCSLWRSPLDGFETTVEADPEGKHATLRWKRVKK